MEEKSWWKVDRSGEEWWNNVPDINEHTAWEYPVSTRLQGDGGHPSEVRWRPWPCSSCSKGATPLDFLRRSQATSRKFPKGSWNKVVEKLQARESRWLVDWSEGCSHSLESVVSLPELATGSEHVVYFDEDSKTVTKVTLLKCFGDYNYLSGKRVCQAASTPLLYLDRMLMWKNIFGNAPNPLGVTADGRIVTKQPFIDGEPPTQEEADSFLLKNGMMPIRQECFLWKSFKFKRFEVWIGDTRYENFVKSEGGIIPIDIRLWWRSLNRPASGIPNFQPSRNRRRRR